MKALSLLQPWATLVVLGFKRWETRSRNIGIPLGPLLIHASQRVDDAGFDVYCAFHNRFPQEAKQLPAWADMTRGAIIGGVHVRSTIHDKIFGVIPSPLSEMDKMLGDFTPGRYFAKLEEPVKFDIALITRGYQGVFNIHIDLERIQSEIAKLKSARP